MQNFGLPKQKVVKMNVSIHESPALPPWATVMMMLKDARMGQETIRQRFPVASGLLVEQQCQQVVDVVLALVLALPLVAFFGFQVEVGLASNPVISRAMVVVDQTRLGS